MRYSLSFSFNKLGHGDLLFIIDGDVKLTYEARTGSINKAGQLVNSIPEIGIWMGREAPLITLEKEMIVNNFGWKYRLWTPEGKWSHILIHPDGGLPGTDGCIGLQGTNAKPLFAMLNMASKAQKTIPCSVSKIVEIDEPIEIKNT